MNASMPQETPPPALPSADHRRRLALIGLIAFFLPLAYAYSTGHVWEDYFITFRHAAKLVHGHGLLYNPPERVHGFTSPLGTLLPALFYAVTGARAYEPALWIFRVVSAAAFAGGMVLLARTFMRAAGGAGGWPIALAVALCILDAKSVAFSVNGMETGFMLLFLAWALHAVWARGPSAAISWRQLGFAWAGLQWTRPDGCVYIALMGMAALLFSEAPRRGHAFMALLKAAVVCALLYLPWFIFAWVYYGSPVPHTVRAKTIFTQAYLRKPDLLDRIGVILEATWSMSAAVFQPIYAGKADWPAIVRLASRCAAVVGFIYWLIPGADRLGRAASMMFAGTCLYFGMTAMFPWYAPPAAILGLIAVASAVVTAWRRTGPFPRIAATALALLVLAHQAVVFAGTWKQMLIQQAEIEDASRTQIGLYIRQHAGPGDRVYLEMLGYIGYFSDAHMLDFPGLVSPDVVRVRRETGLGMAALPAVLKPEWIVARESEVELLRDNTPGFSDHYRLVNLFDARPRLWRYGRFYGADYVNYDATIYVLRRVQ